jgi:hypothetical protein
MVPFCQRPLPLSVGTPSALSGFAIACSDSPSACIAWSCASNAASPHLLSGLLHRLESLHDRRRDVVANLHLIEVRGQRCRVRLGQMVEQPRPGGLARHPNPGREGDATEAALETGAGGHRSALLLNPSCDLQAVHTIGQDKQEDFQLKARGRDRMNRFGQHSLE